MIHNSWATTVFTTAERCDVFRSVVGADADFQINPFETMPLELTLANIAAAGGKIVVCDEAHFLSIEDLARGVSGFLDDPHSRKCALRLVIVCSERKVGDKWLAFFAGYCGICDIVYDRRGVEIATELVRVLKRSGTRLDVLELLYEMHIPDVDTLASNAGQIACDSHGALRECSEKIAINIEEFMKNGLQVTLTMHVSPM